MSDLEIWKIKNVIKKYSNARGSGTSMVSLMIKSGAQISLTNKMLTEEYGTATNIKSRVNRQSVQSAIVSAQHKLKRYSITPPNGLVVLCGTMLNEDGKPRKVSISFEPPRKLTCPLYLCDNRFHLEPLNDLLVNHDTYGFIIIDGNGILLATVCGNQKNTVFSTTVDLPKKHGRGGQSAVRFARLRLEARHNYLMKSNEQVKKAFTKDNVPTVKGIILAGSADLKIKLTNLESFPYTLKPKILGLFDITYGQKNGLSQAIEMSKTVMADSKLMDEKKIVSTFFEHIAKDTSLYCYGIKDILYALDMGAIAKLIVWDDLAHVRYVLADDEVVILEKEKDIAKHANGKTIKSSEPYIEWLVDNHSKIGIDKLCIISDKSQEGIQFCRGFSGIGGILRWTVDFSHNYETAPQNNVEDDYDMDDLLGDEYADYEDDFI